MTRHKLAKLWRVWLNGTHYSDGAYFRGEHEAVLDEAATTFGCDKGELNSRLVSEHEDV